ncbi:hypothetical protein A2115_03105 [Candidatus Woesebacteria bacterium GWA1_41_8]|uniref:WbqC-like protein n=1 Tax=Candidatus Woesebacteria bacterium GWA1_41_8 TaxID=1802471 RepID=A0A1F7WK70_9BACT|nr:MAG: hypothetical protein A2115_03105 [Candidatus Woesebacteria bacterium GWA1_41_8]
MTERILSICQSNYLPWKGYLDMINMSDEFIIYDDMQYTRRDWRNRNKIKTPQGLLWLTIPVQVKGKFFQKIKDTLVSDPEWNVRHWKTIRYHYSKAPYFEAYREIFEELYLGSTSLRLSDINYRFLMGICGILGIKTKLSWSMDYHLIDGKTERLVDLCKQAGATHYISGPAAKNYIDPLLFEQAGIKLTFMDYSGYPEYPQLYPPFEHKVSVIDLIFQTGPDAPKYMKSFK